ncbi:Hsp20/alpha crystallin family protein [Caballeronia humi]|uniref:Heat shock protein Hsp20 n=1 Tax=Caballeronia humi TaxID=326474 RepID=A0A158IYI4_9BURK|nr:Hsp20/alpha crystallin family protein [Caballeronia humi]SAL61101.1 heat shock protein Hsp20 [Caballeronia humi]
MNENTQVAQRNAGNAGEVARRNDDRARRVTLTPAVDIIEDTHGVTLWADLPGVPREKLDVKVHDGRLYIEAEAAVSTPDNIRLNHVEVRAPLFARAFTLSDEFDTSRIDANLQNGVLKLSIPRREEARPRRVQIRAE